MVDRPSPQFYHQRMSEWLETFAFTFVPLFIAIDPLGNLPFILALSEGISGSERRKMVHIAVLTAAVVGLAFLFFGQLILNVIGISVGAFAIAGGLVLLVLSVKYITTGQIMELIREEMVAVVPIGTPLTAGPATITTLLLLVLQFPLRSVLLSFALNLLVVWGIFLLSNQIVRITGRGGLTAISKVFSLLLAVIGVSMMLRGLELIGLITLPT